MRRCTGRSELAPYGPRRVPWVRRRLVGLLAAITSTLPVATTATAQDASTEVVWNRMFRVPDGRLFVTDGAISLDAEVAEPRALPGTELPPNTGIAMDRYMSADLPNEYRLGDLERGPYPQSYEAPSGVLLAAKYVEFLRSAVPGARLRMGSYLDPVVIVSDGRAVGLVMAMARP